MDPTFKFTGKVWLYNGKATWHFITLPLDLSKEIKSFSDSPKRGFGSVRVKVRIGKTSWNTSIFPNKKGSYVLPLKAIVRKAEGINAEDEIKVIIALQ